MKKDKFTQGFICAVACLLNSHGSTTEAKDMLSAIGNPGKLELQKKGCDGFDIDTLEKHELLNQE